MEVREKLGYDFVRIGAEYVVEICDKMMKDSGGMQDNETAHRVAKEFQNVILSYSEIELTKRLSEVTALVEAAQIVERAISIALENKIYPPRSDRMFDESNYNINLN